MIFFCRKFYYFYLQHSYSNKQQQKQNNAKCRLELISGFNYIWKFIRVAIPYSSNFWRRCLMCKNNKIVFCEDSKCNDVVTYSKVKNKCIDCQVWRWHFVVANECVVFDVAHWLYSDILEGFEDNGTSCSTRRAQI